MKALHYTSFAAIPVIVMFFFVKTFWLFAGWFALPICLYKAGAPVILAAFFGLLLWGGGVILMKRFS